MRAEALQRDCARECFIFHHDPLVRNSYTIRHWAKFTTCGCGRFHDRRRDGLLVVDGKQVIFARTHHTKHANASIRECSAAYRKARISAESALFTSQTWPLTVITERRKQT